MDVMMRRCCKWRQSHPNLFSCMSPMIPKTTVAVDEDVRDDEALITSEEEWNDEDDDLIRVLCRVDH
jgi:hypothetical protein